MLLTFRKTHNLCLKRKEKKSLAYYLKANNLWLFQWWYLQSKEILLDLSKKMLKLSI
jgi:hypothetical protein